MLKLHSTGLRPILITDMISCEDWTGPDRTGEADTDQVHSIKQTL